MKMVLAPNSSRSMQPGTVESNESRNLMLHQIIGIVMAWSFTATALADEKYPASAEAFKNPEKVTIEGLPTGYPVH